MTEPRRANPPDSGSRNLPLPGMAAISLWMLTLSVLGVIGVLTHRYPAGASRIVILILSTFFAFAGLGLMRKRRWGWALTLGAVVLCMSFGFYSLFHSHQGQWVVMALVNLVFFLYLVRPEVTQYLR
ncbi:MAG TPA: DUF2127 domain-containing protein [Acidobacteriaceae bacterium]|jgi:uncharacterized membrane protein (DUF2068 family)